MGLMADDDEDDDIPIKQRINKQNNEELFHELTVGSLFQHSTYLNIVSVYDSMVNCIHCVMDYSHHQNKHKKSKSSLNSQQNDNDNDNENEKCYYSSISNGNAQQFANDLVEIMIRSYSLNNESKSLYPEGVLHDMFVSSEQLINTLGHIVLYRDDSNNLISFILRQLLSINAPPNCITNDIVSTLSSSVSSMRVSKDNDVAMNDNNENIAPSSKQTPRNPRKRTRDQMSSDEASPNNDYDELRETKRFKSSHTRPINSSININVSTDNDMNNNKDTKEYWCNSLPLPICNWILRLMLDSPKISKVAISKYCKQLFKGFWKFVYDTIIKEFDAEINKTFIDDKEEKGRDEDDDNHNSEKSEHPNITIASQHISTFLRLVLSSDNELRTAFVHESMVKIHKLALFVNESIQKLESKANNKSKQLFVFQNKSLSLLFRSILIMHGSVLQIIQKSQEKEEKDRKDTNNKQIDIKYNDRMASVMNDAIIPTVFPSPNKPRQGGFGYNTRICNDPTQQHQSFYLLKYPNQSYQMDEVRERLFLSPITDDTILNQTADINALFKEQGLQHEMKLCIKPLNIDTLRVLRSCQDVTAQDYVYSVIYFAHLLSNDLKENFKYNAWGIHVDDDHDLQKKTIFLDLTRLLCTLPISKYTNNYHDHRKGNDKKVPLKIKEIRDSLTWKKIDPSNPMHLIVVARVLSLSFFYSLKKLPLKRENNDNNIEEWKHDIPSDLLIWMLESVKSICDYLKQTQTNDNSIKKDHWWCHCIINMIITTINHQLIRDGTTIAQLPTLTESKHKNQKSKKKSSEKTSNSDKKEKHKGSKNSNSKSNRNKNKTMKSTGIDQMFNLSASRINDIIYPRLLSLCEYYISHYRTFIKEYCYTFEKEEAQQKAVNKNDIKPHKISQNSQMTQLMNEYIKNKPNKSINNFPPDCFTKLNWNIGSLDSFPISLDKIFRQHILAYISQSNIHRGPPPLAPVAQKPQPRKVVNGVSILDNLNTSNRNRPQIQVADTSDDNQSVSTHTESIHDNDNNMENDNNGDQYDNVMEEDDDDDEDIEPDGTNEDDDSSQSTEPNEEDDADLDESNTLIPPPPAADNNDQERDQSTPFADTGAAEDDTLLIDHSALWRHDKSGLDLDVKKEKDRVWDPNSLHTMQGYLDFVSNYNVLGVKSTLQAIMHLLYKFVHRFPELFVDEKKDDEEKNEDQDKEEEEEKKDVKMIKDVTKVCKDEIIKIFLPAMYNKAFAFLSPNIDHSIKTMIDTFKVKDDRINKTNIEIRRLFDCFMSAKNLLSNNADSKAQLYCTLTVCIMSIRRIKKRDLIEYFKSSLDLKQNNECVMGLKLDEIMKLLFEYLFCAFYNKRDPEHTITGWIKQITKFIDYLFHLFTYSETLKNIELLHQCLDKLPQDDISLLLDKLLNPNNAKRESFDYGLNIIKYHIQHIHQYQLLKKNQKQLQNSEDSKQETKDNENDKEQKEENVSKTKQPKESSQQNIMTMDNEIENGPSPGFISGAIKYYSDSFPWRPQFLSVHLDEKNIKNILLDENLTTFLSLTLVNKTPHIFINTILNAFGDDLTKIIPSRIAQFLNIDFIELLRNPRPSLSSPSKYFPKKPINTKHSALSMLAEVASQEAIKDHTPISDSDEDIEILDNKPKPTSLVMDEHQHQIINEMKQFRSNFKNQNRDNSQEKGGIQINLTPPPSVSTASANNNKRRITGNSSPTYSPTSPTYSPTSPVYSTTPSQTKPPLAPGPVLNEPTVPQQMNKITNYYRKMNQPIPHPITKSKFDEQRRSNIHDYANGVLYYCTYNNTGRTNYPKQSLYRCYSCDVNCVVCSLCAQLCHYKHDLVYQGEIGGYCDCGPNDMARSGDKGSENENNNIYECDKCKCNEKPLPIDDNLISHLTILSFPNQWIL